MKTAMDSDGFRWIPMDLVELNSIDESTVCLGSIASTANQMTCEVALVIGQLFTIEAAHNLTSNRIPINSKWN